MSLKTKLNNNQLAIGGWAMISHAAIVEIMAATGIDWVCIDLEHTSTTYTDVENMVRAAQLHQTPALCRLTSNDEDQIKRVMDIGASGIIVPMVKTAAEARAAVQAMHYPPLGHRGVSLHRGAGFGETFKEYQDWLINDAVCIVQIEHIDAVNNLEEILAVQGVDGYFMGPYDLSASMGLTGQLDHPDVVAAMTRVRDVAASMGKPGGLHIVEPEPERLEDAISKGFTMLGYSIDARIIDTVMRQMIARVKS